MIYTGEASDPTVDDSGDAPPNWNYELIQHYVRDLTGNELAVYNDTTVTFWNVYGLDNVGKINYSDNSWNYYLKDHLGSPRVVIDQNGDIISAEDLDMWGYRMSDRVFDSDSSFYKFTGKERDVTTGYDYFGARYYISRIGNWTSIDPMFEKHYDFSPYNYVLRNPLYFIDPDGRQVKFSSEEALRNNEIQMLRYMLPVSFSDYINYTTDESDNFILNTDLLSQADNSSNNAEYEMLLNIAQSSEVTEMFFVGTAERIWAYNIDKSVAHSIFLSSDHPGHTFVSGNVNNSELPSNPSISGNNEVYVLNNETQREQVKTIAHELYHVYRYINFQPWGHRTVPDYYYRIVESQAGLNYDTHFP